MIESDANPPKNAAYWKRRAKKLEDRVLRLEVALREIKTCLPNSPQTVAVIDEALKP